MSTGASVNQEGHAADEGSVVAGLSEPFDLTIQRYDFNRERIYRLTLPAIKQT